MEAQEIFDKVAKHLATQARKSLNSSGEECMYLAPDGSKCALGIFITSDDYYDVSMEGADVVRLKEDGLLPKHLWDHLPLLDALQTVHDANEPDSWEYWLREVAARWQLSPKVLDTLDWSECNNYARPTF